MILISTSAEHPLIEYNNIFSRVCFFSTSIKMIELVIIFFILFLLYARTRREGKTNEFITQQSLANETTGPETLRAKEVKDRLEMLVLGKPGPRVSTIKSYSLRDGKTYYVHPTYGADTAANMFAELNKRTSDVIFEIKKRMDKTNSIVYENKDITHNMERLVKKHYNKPIDFEEYHNPNDLIVGSNTSKGSTIEICLRSKYDETKFNSMNTTFRVVLHELAHSADTEYRTEERHGKDFERLHKYLLSVATDMNYYNCEEYEKSNKSFCGVTLTEEYCL